MSDAPDRNDLNRALFINLIVMLGTSAMQQLGKTANAAGKPDDVHLEGAQMSIDMLDMLEARTRGNLADDEKRILADTLTSLRLSYVEVEAREKAKTPAAPPQPGPQPAKEAGESKVKFRKSYGES